MHWALTPASVASMSISRKSKPKLASQAVQLVPPTHTQRVGGVIGTRETNHGNSAETEGTEPVVRGQRTRESETGRAVYHHSAGKDRAPSPRPHAFNNSSKGSTVHRERSRGHWEAPTHHRTSGTACLGQWSQPGNQEAGVLLNPKPYARTQYTPRPLSHPTHCKTNPNPTGRVVVQASERTKLQNNTLMCKRKKKHTFGGVWLVARERERNLWHTHRWWSSGSQALHRWRQQLCNPPCR